MSRRKIFCSSAFTALSLIGLTVAAIGAGCDPRNSNNDTGGNGGTTTNATGGGGMGGMGTTELIGGSSLNVGGGQMGCDEGSATIDDDMDGWTEAEGDCNDCDAKTNPGAAEVIAEPDENGNLPMPADEDCDGLFDKDDPDVDACDDALPIDSQDPMDAVRAIGFCHKDDNGDFKFLQKASWVMADGLPPNANVDMAKYHLGHGLLDHFGSGMNNPREGARMLALSSGTARNDTEPGFVSRNFDKGYSSNPPFGFSGQSPDCPGVQVPTSSVQDVAALELELIPPTNAEGLQFSFQFFTYEWPQFICTIYNDFFWAHLSQNNNSGNISFDSKSNAISVNAAFLSQCGCPGVDPASMDPCVAPPNPMMGQITKNFDCDGVNLLAATDFDGSNVGTPSGWTNGSTGWLVTQASVDPSAPGQPPAPVRLRFVIFDSGVLNGVKDHNVDSTVLVDKFAWRAKPGETITVPE